MRVRVSFFGLAELDKELPLKTSAEVYLSKVLQLFHSFPIRPFPTVRFSDVFRG